MDRWIPPLGLGASVLLSLALLEWLDTRPVETPIKLRERGVAATDPLGATSEGTAATSGSSTLRSGEEAPRSGEPMARSLVRGLDLQARARSLEEGLRYVGPERRDRDDVFEDLVAGLGRAAETGLKARFARWSSKALERQRDLLERYHESGRSEELRALHNRSAQAAAHELQGMFGRRKASALLARLPLRILDGHGRPRPVPGILRTSEPISEHDCNEEPGTAGAKDR